MTTAELQATLRQLRGANSARPLDARRIAGTLEQPGCVRRQLLDVCGAPLDRIAAVLGCPDDGQSPFAISRGNAFEERVFENGMAELIRIVRETLDFELENVAQVDLSLGQLKEIYGRADNAMRVRETRNHIRTLITGGDGSCNLIRHPMTTIDVGGVTSFIEADALSFYAGGQITTVEVKSFQAIDDNPDPHKVGAALRQSAVYIVSLQDTVEELGFSPTIVSTKVLLILARNFSMVPVGYVRDIGTEVRRLRRRLESLPATAEIAASIPAGLTLPRLPSRGADAEEIRGVASELANAVSALPCRFGDSCMSCPMFRYCREEARSAELVVASGSAVAEVCGGVPTVGHALSLASGERQPSNATEFAVAQHLGRAAGVAERLNARAVPD